MFEDLTKRLDKVFRDLRGVGKLSEANVHESLRDIRRVLLEADVHVQVVRDFLTSVEEKALGQEVMRSVAPAQLIVKIVHDELVRLLGEKESRLNVSSQTPTVYMIVVLQGSGKTTFCAKLARYLKTKGKRPLLVAADLQRPAAQDQLQVLGDSIGVPVFRGESKDPIAVCDAALRQARADGRQPYSQSRAHSDRSGSIHFFFSVMSGQRSVISLRRRARLTGH